MTNRVNEYLKKRPLLGTAVFIGIIAIGTLVGVMILEPSRSLASIFSDGGIWLTIGLIALPSGLVYFSVSKRI